MANWVPVQGFLTSLYKTESHPIRQALQRMKVEINANDQVDLDELDQKALADQLKKGV